jgi:hypothetical protein
VWGVDVRKWSAGHWVGGLLNRHLQFARLDSSGHKPRHQGGGLAANFALKIGQGFFASPLVALLFIEKNRQGSKQGQHLRRVGFPYQASVLVLGAIPPMMLAILDLPMASG